jgi:hypothetical protein
MLNSCFLIIHFPNYFFNYQCSIVDFIFKIFCKCSLMFHCSSLFHVGCPLSIVCCLLPIGRCPLSLVPIAYCSLSLVPCPFFIVRCSLSVVLSLLFLDASCFYDCFFIVIKILVYKLL